MKFIHPAAALCFLLALTFYVTASISAAVVLFIVGAAFELAAWTVLLGGDRGDG